jgi:hypothetical protein
MGAWKKVLVHVAWSGLFISGFPGATLPVAAQRSVTPQHEDTDSPSKQPLVAKVEAQARFSELPDSPGAILSKSAESAQQQSGAEQRREAAPPAPPLAQSQTPEAQAKSSQAWQTSPQRPVGTAAAEAPDASGVAASQPAGVAIAPAKQRRVRTIVLRMGAIVGAGVAVGSVVALTQATPSKPPGAH